ncbi:unnamed protein product [Strongylus vulgaris]|uniref:Uncharacterized protein n=1 Tax=Strongylus vulgaris TaxID=40348 RepID=A0A3P7I3S3_STRVU|nr:unnamed protein product [Strongylus vulgaris]
MDCGDFPGAAIQLCVQFIGPLRRGGDLGILGKGFLLSKMDAFIAKGRGNAYCGAGCVVRLHRRQEREGGRDFALAILMRRLPRGFGVLVGESLRASLEPAGEFGGSCGRRWFGWGLEGKEFEEEEDFDEEGEEEEGETRRVGDDNG